MRYLVLAALLVFGGAAVARPKRDHRPAAQPRPTAATSAPKAEPAATSAAPAPAPAPEPAGGGNARDVVRRESRIEFDERFLQGQRASGAIYLFQRGESDFHSLVDLPESFRERTLRQVYPEGTTQR